MAGETGEVSSIGVKLTLDAGEFMGGMKAAQGSLNTFQEQAVRAGSGAGQLKAGGGKQVASGPSSAQNLSGVNVSLVLNKGQLAELRAEITKGLGTIPVNITPVVSKAVRGEAQAVMAAVATPTIGTRSGAAHAVASAVRQNLPGKAHGGPVQAGRAVIVGEHRPEVFIPRSHGRIEPDAERFYRAQEQFRRREAELAALEYNQQRRHEREMGRAQGGPAKRGGLPRGYRLEFYSRDDQGEAVHDVYRLERPGGYYTPVKKPILKGPSSAAGIVAVITKGAKVVGTYPLSFDPASEAQGVPTPYGSYHPDYSFTDIEHRRKGLATAAYVKAERFTGRPVAPSGVQLPPGKAYWARESRPAGEERPFGKAWGKRTIDQSTRDDLDRAAEHERLRLAGISANANFANAPLAAPFPARGISSTAGGRYGIEPPPYDAQGRPSFGSSASISQFSRTPIRDRLRARARLAAQAQPGYRSLWSQERWASYQPGEAAEIMAQEAQWRIQNRRMGHHLEAPLRLRSGGPMVDAGPFGRMAGGPVERSFRVADPMGLHMRPSSILAQVAQRYPEAAIQIRNLTNGASPEAGFNARSMMGWAQLMAIPGDEIGMMGEGENASLALHQLARLGGSPKITGLAKRRLKARWNAAHAWRGATALAYRATMENEGGTFPLAGGPQPSSGYAVGIATGTSHLVPAGDPIAFMRGYRAQKRAQVEAGGFPPYVGTWLHQGQIHIDPSAVFNRRRDADLVARAKEQLAFFDLKRFEEIPTSTHKLRAQAERINQLIMSGAKHRGGGGSARRAHAFGITRSHGNIRNWENAQWRDQEMREIEDRRRAAYEAGVKRRMPGFASGAWETFPLPAEPLVPLAGETEELWGKRAGGLVHAKQGAVVGRMTPEELDFAGNLRAAAAQISPDQLKFGKSWYADAQNWINEQAVRYGIDPITARGVVASLSAGTSWEANKTKAHRIFSTHGQGLFGESFPYNMKLDAHRKAKAILEGADPEGVLGHTPKVGAFYRNLGGDLDAVTLDRWAFRTATRGHLSQYGKGSLRNDIDAAYRLVASELGLHPVELQAASWLYEKEANPRLGRKGKPQSFGQLEGIFSPMHRAGGGVISSMLQTAADWSRDPFMAIMSYQAMQQKRAGGGNAGNGLYIVGEIGKEKFVPNRLAHLIPPRVMQQIPKRASGGIVEIGQRRNELFAPPEDGIIIPHRLIDQIPHAREGRYDVKGAMRRAEDPWSGAVAGDLAYGPSRPVSSADRPRPSFGDAKPAMDTILRNEWRAAVAREADKARRGARTAFPAQRANPTEDLSVMRAGAGKAMPSRTIQGAIASISSFFLGGVQQITRAERVRIEAQSAYNKTLKSGDILISKTRAEHDVYYEAFKKETAGHDDAVRGLKKGTSEYKAASAAYKSTDEYKQAAADYHANNKKLLEATRAQKRVEKERYENLDRATQKAMPTNAGIIRNLGVIIGATTAYGMAMQAASMVIEQAMIPAAGKMVDEFVGWTPTFTRVSTAMADTTRQMGGNYKAAVASAAATAGLSDETATWTEESLKAATMAKAGSKAFTEAKDLIAGSMGSSVPNGSNLIINSAEKSIQMFTWGLTDASAILDRFKGGPAGAPQGLYGGYGGVGGTALFADQLGGGPGFQQQITDLLKSTRQGNEGVTMGEVGLGLSTGGLVGAAVAVGAGVLDSLRGSSAGGPGAEYTTSTLRAAQGRAAQQEGVLAYGIRRTQGGEVDRLKAMGADKTVVEMAELGYVYTDSVGNLVANLDELNRAVGQAAKGMTIPEMGTWFKTITRQMGGQFQMAQQTQARAINTEIPIETWKSLLQQPLLGAGAGVVGRGGVSAAGFSGQTATWAKGLLSDIQSSNQSLTDMGKAGFEAARADVQMNNPLSLPQFDTLAAEANTASAKIAGLNNQIAKLSQEAAQANWANQIRIARRSLGDALGMLGKVGGTRLGQLQREQWLNSRASQQLGLQLQQRQITTQLAQAQFFAPGETGEERYFKQKQSIAEAGVAQQQLGFSFKEFTISGQIWKITAERAATDAQKAISVMTVAQNAQLGAALASQEINNQQRKLGVTMGKIDAILGTAKNNWGTVMQAAGQYVTQFGGSVKDAMKEVYKSLGYTVKEDKTGKVTISGSSNVGQEGGPGWSSQPNSPKPAGENWTWNGYGWVKGNAKGYLGNFARGAMMTVGEAGPETVAILRNPRAALMGSGGGGAPVSVAININGPVVRNDQDIQSLAIQVAAEVERSLSRKGQMFGLRGPAV